MNIEGATPLGVTQPILTTFCLWCPIIKQTMNFLFIFINPGGTREIACIHCRREEVIFKQVLKKKSTKRNSSQQAWGLQTSTAECVVPPVLLDLAGGDQMGRERMQLSGRGTAADVTEEAMDLIIKMVDVQLGSIVAMTKHLVEAADRGKVYFGSLFQRGHRPSRWRVHSCRSLWQSSTHSSQARTRGGTSSQGCLLVTSD